MNTLFLRVFWLTLIGWAPLAQVNATTHLAVAGHIAFVNGDVQLNHSQKPNRTAQTGDPVYVGDHIQTQANAHIHLRMVDNAFVALRPESQLVISIYDYNPDQPKASRIRLDLQQGTSRAVTGKGGQAAKHQYRFNTPLAAIGLRGTDYTVTTEADKTRISVAQGGVIVSPLGADCTSTQLGPCNTPLTRVLTAEMRNTILEVTPSQAPRLMTQPQASAGTVKNDAAVPLSDATSTKVALQQASERMAQGVSQPASVTEAQAPAVPTPDQIQANPGRPEPLARWGRWTALAQQLPQGSSTINQVFEQIKDFQIVASNQAFALAYPAQASIGLPEQGRVQFGLISAEAYVKENNQSRTATVQNGQLEMNFGLKTFTTQVNVLTAPNVQNSIQVQGTVDSYGRLKSNPQSDTNLQGITLNKGLEAAYLFEKTLNNGATLSGATQWAR